MSKKVTSLQSVLFLITCVMPKLKKIPKLLDLSINKVHYLVKSEAIRVSKVMDNKFYYYEVEGSPNYSVVERDNLEIRGEMYLDEQISAFKEYIFGHVPFTLRDKVLHPILQGIAGAVKQKKSEWSPATIMSRFIKSMAAILDFANLMVLPSRKYLDLEQVPKMIRNHLFNNLDKFINTTTLILGSGSGGWCNSYAEKFCLSLPHMKYLVHFSFKYDCTANVLQVLSENCGKTLRILDIERSRQVSDESVEYIKSFPGLIKMNIFLTNLSNTGLVKNKIHIFKSILHDSWKDECNFFLCKM